MNLKINQIASLYDYLGKDIENDFFNDVKQKIKIDNIFGGSPKEIEYKRKKEMSEISSEELSEEDEQSH